MKKSTTFGLIATVALTMAPLSAFAQTINDQNSFQGGVQTNATVGHNNNSQQIGVLNSNQYQENFNAGTPAVNLQSSQQHLLQESAVIGENNHGLQVGTFDNNQSQYNVHPHVPEVYYIQQPEH